MVSRTKKWHHKQQLLSKTWLFKVSLMNYLRFLAFLTFFGVMGQGCFLLIDPIPATDSDFEGKVFSCYNSLLNTTFYMRFNSDHSLDYCYNKAGREGLGTCFYTGTWEIYNEGMAVRTTYDQSLFDHPEYFNHAYPIAKTIDEKKQIDITLVWYDRTIGEVNRSFRMN